MAKITRHQGVSHARADELAAAAAEVDTDAAEPVGAAPKTRRRGGRHEAPEASA